MRRLVCKRYVRSLSAILQSQPASCFVSTAASPYSYFTEHILRQGSHNTLKGEGRSLVFSVSFSSRLVHDGSVQQFRLAQTGEGIKECELIQWFVKEGDAVEEFGRICEVQSDKASVEITSPYAGVVLKLHHAPGGLVQVGEVLADIQAEGGGEVQAQALPAEACGGRGKGAATAAEAGGAEVAAAGQGRTAASEASGGGEGRAVLTSPAVRRLAREHGIDLTQVAPSGPGGRVTKDDVMALLDDVAASPGTGVSQAGAARQQAAPAAPTSTVMQQPPSPLPPLSGAAAPAVPAPTLVPLRGYRKAMLKSMEAAGQVPHFHLCDDVDMGALVELRDMLRRDPSLLGTKLTFLPFLMKAAALALRQHPMLNASLAPDRSAVVQHNTINIGVAMATPYGLVVPNIKHVESKSIHQVARELGELQEGALHNKLRQEDISGGTFTLSNIGTIGGSYTTPLVNPPEVAIMALGRVQRLPRFGPDGCTVVPAQVMSISLGADHRVVDGASLAEFAREWKRYVECPGALILHMK